MNTDYLLIVILLASLTALGLAISLQIRLNYLVAENQKLSDYLTFYRAKSAQQEKTIATYKGHFTRTGKSS